MILNKNNKKMNLNQNNKKIKMIRNKNNKKNKKMNKKKIFQMKIMKFKMKNHYLMFIIQENMKIKKRKYIGIN